VGEINDEYDEVERPYVKLNSNTYLFEAKTMLTDFQRELDLDDELFEEVEGDADSLAGLLLELKGDFPELHESIDFHHLTFEVMEMDERRIMKIKVVVHNTSKLDEADA
jgi:CBS domain containing-hemolysin-like protein